MKVVIEGERIILRPLKKSDDIYLKKYVDKEIVRYTTLPYPYSINHARKFIQKSKKQLRKRKPKEIHLGIELKQTGEIIGMMSFVKVDWRDETAEVGYWLARKYWGRGLATEALRVLLNHGFKKFKFKKIYARVYQPNIRSIKLLERIGFKLEGRLRKQKRYRFGKKRLDELIYGILPEEFKVSSVNL